MANAYDLVGTLAEVSYPAETITSTIYKPKGQFIIVSAQSKGDHSNLRQQIKETFPNCSRIIFVATSTDRQEGYSKARVLKRINASSYTDNNPNILRAIRERLPNIDLYRMTSNGSKSKFDV